MTISELNGLVRMAATTDDTYGHKLCHTGVGSPSSPGAVRFLAALSVFIISVTVIGFLGDNPRGHNKFW